MAKASSSDVKAGGASVRIGADDSPFRNVIAGTEKRLKAFGANAVSLGARMSGVGVGLGTGLLAAVKSFSDVGSKLADTSKRTGDTTANLSGMGFAAQQSGADIEALEGAFSKMAPVIAGAIKSEAASVKLLNELGLKASDLKGKLPTEQFEIFADKLSGITDNDTKIDLVKSIFGKAGTSLIPLLDEGSAGIAKLRAEAERLGLVMSSSDVDAADKLGDSLDSLYAAAGGVVTKIGGALAPALIGAVEYLVNAAAAVSQFANANRALISGIAGGVALLTAAGVAIAALGVISYVAGAGLSALTLGFGLSGIASGVTTVAVWIYNAALAVLSSVSSIAAATTAGLGAAIAFLASPLGLAVAAIVVVSAVLLALTVSFQDIKSAASSVFTGLVSQVQGALSATMSFFSGLASTAASTFGGISDAIAAGNIQGAVSILWAGVQVAWIQGTDGVKSIWNAAMIYIEGTMDKTGIALGSLWAGIKGTFTAVVVSIEGVWDTMAANLGMTMNTVFQNIKGAVDVFAGAMKSTLIEIMAGIAKTKIALQPLMSGAAKTRAYEGIESTRKDDQANLAAELKTRAAARQSNIDTVNKTTTDNLESRRAGRDKRLESTVDTSEADNAARKREADRVARMTAGSQPSEALAARQAELDSLLEIAALEKDVQAIDTTTVKKGKAGVDAANAASGALPSAEAQARGSSSVASTIAKAVNGASSVPEKSLVETKKSNTLLAEQNKLLKKYMDIPAVSFTEIA